MVGGVLKPLCGLDPIHRRSGEGFEDVEVLILLFELVPRLGPQEGGPYVEHPGQNIPFLMRVLGSYEKSRSFPVSNGGEINEEQPLNSVAK